MPLAPYITRLASAPPLPSEQIRALVAQAQAGDRAARELVVRHNARFVVSCVAGWARSCPGHEDDLFAAGLMGLNRAVDTYDPKHGTAFLSYAKPWISVEMQRHAWKAGSPLAMNQHANFTAQRMADPDAQQARRAEIARARMAPLCLDLPAPWMDDEGPALGDTLADLATPSPEALVAQAEEAQQARARVRELMKGLRPNHRLVAELRLLTDPADRPTLEEIGARLGVSRERVRQLEKQALERLGRAAKVATPPEAIRQHLQDHRVGERTIYRRQAAARRVARPLEPIPQPQPDTSIPEEPTTMSDPTEASVATPSATPPRTLPTVRTCSAQLHNRQWPCPNPALPGKAGCKLHPMEEEQGAKAQAGEGDQHPVLPTGEPCPGPACTRRVQVMGLCKAHHAQRRACEAAGKPVVLRPIGVRIPGRRSPGLARLQAEQEGRAGEVARFQSQIDALQARVAEECEATRKAVAERDAALSDLGAVQVARNAAQAEVDRVRRLMEAETAEAHRWREKAAALQAEVEKRERNLATVVESNRRLTERLRQGKRGHAAKRPTKK